ncbi:hypothetical protein [Sinomonas atrocyanea]|uniref:hypothetical protein n=1 Tax=Sinomonas atrocyanea TaxID=37927 RepID=UPI00285E3BFA|nr:hypothetical protein [Sinomonas atrocyanea]MDR6620840.1 hypothetical protein [Sinomonas atrocyanea]
MRTRPWPWVLPAAALLLFAGLAGCSATGGAAATGPASSAAAPQASAAPPVASAMADGALSQERCQKSPDGTWSYAARLTNHGSGRAAFTVAIGLTRATAVLDHAMVQKTLGPGESADISATGFGKDAPSAGTDCGAAVSKESAE